jgi:hypothetical protein
MLTLTYLHGNVIQELDLVPSRVDSRVGVVDALRAQQGWIWTCWKEFRNSASLLSISIFRRTDLMQASGVRWACMQMCQLQSAQMSSFSQWIDQLLQSLELRVPTTRNCTEGPVLGADRTKGQTGTNLGTMVKIPKSI